MIRERRMGQALTDAHADDQEEENELGLFLLLVYSCMHTLQSGAF